MKININAASEDELLLLPGVNTKEAKSIVEKRKRNDGFTSQEEFMNWIVHIGIPPHLYKAIEQMVNVEHMVSSSARVIDF